MVLKEDRWEGYGGGYEERGMIENLIPPPLCALQIASRGHLPHVFLEELGSAGCVGSENLGTAPSPRYARLMKACIQGKVFPADESFIQVPRFTEP